ncbi:hypothetical protein VCUG_01232 [Vavraia culicis subsp. floridensis]|uniref:phosphogluconate dehydrogenase (NADP(+)-dependent, decarboxylating) n=1 Tax=Vavraia culicis (isolate floridensis) TaxID=948595 RepID=L2GU87_VAVCU|nr:uncharacterized protein VCUG_01232 [Vavraia culicis subsp. floridensis]ELA47236.1 hypothetical protein VCUG_01232 [Vavraia culicis subsp. floridensis]
MHTKNKQAQLGVIGLAPMGRALALNLRDKGYVVAVYNRTGSRTKEFEEECEREGETIKTGEEESRADESGNDRTASGREAKDKAGSNEANANVAGDKTAQKGSFIYTYAIDEFVRSLQAPRKVLAIIKSDATDELMALMSPHLSKDDYFLDFSNSTPDVTELRSRNTNYHYLGIGISGGTEGARNNGGLMVGGPSSSYAVVQPILMSISNSVGYFGDNASGHFVKMVHNAIEYALMGVIAEFYEVLNKLGKEDLMAKWNEETKMYLVDAALQVTGNERFDKIEGRVEMKGTGAWVLKEMSGRCRTLLLNSAIDQRMSSMHGTTHGAQDGSGQQDNTVITKAKSKDTTDSDAPSDNVLVAKSKLSLKKAFKMISFSALSEKCLKNAFIFCLKMCYKEGLDILRNNGTYNINVKEAVRVWKKGCIIQSDIIDEEIDAKHCRDLKKVILYAVNKNIRIANASNCYYKEMRDDRQIMLLAGLRDYFGAHGVYIDGEWTNIEWRKK